ncbi:MAG: peptidoglycan DD-metalloendopeptidase family protein [Polyangiaceae bacterium]|nr:peptidoglycan DD-metalloendopeptidase family protein [Polyangiaceae bacterium]MBK8938788.1 peptidoglycan DD-metalloendopeptidase family protein [Polyangiaceae bacterium]
MFVVGSSPARAEPPLYAPWPCGTSYSITQGHNTGSHDGEGAWAWDIGIPVGADVSAPADGVVRRIEMSSTTGGCSSAFANDANYVVLDFGDGTEALFLHLQANSSSLSVGDFVSQGDVVGKVGLTGWVCGAHLHFQIQQTCSSWWCQSVPAELVDFGDPSYGMTLESNNCPELEPCGVLGGGETIFDERMACFSRETTYWWSVGEGYADHHFYTFGTDLPEDDTIGTYSFEVQTAGTYRVEVFVPSTEADTVNASYDVDPGTGPVELGPVDQSVQKGWVVLGELEFSEGANRTLALGDATGESSDLDRKIAYDAVRFTFVPAGEGGGGQGGAGAGGDASSGGAAAQGGDAAAGGEAQSGGSSSSSDDDDAASDGCSCQSAGAASEGGASFWLVTLGAALALSSARRPSRARR